MVQLLQETGWGLLQIKDRTVTGACNSTCGYLSERSPSWIGKRQLHAHIHGSIIHNSQEVEATQWRLTDEHKENVV